MSITNHWSDGFKVNKEDEVIVKLNDPSDSLFTS